MAMAHGVKWRGAARPAPPHLAARAHSTARVFESESGARRGPDRVRDTKSRENACSVLRSAASRGHRLKIAFSGRHCPAANFGATIALISLAPGCSVRSVCSRPPLMEGTCPHAARTCSPHPPGLPTPGVATWMWRDHFQRGGRNVPRRSRRSSTCRVRPRGYARTPALRTL